MDPGVTRRTRSGRSPFSTTVWTRSRPSQMIRAGQGLRSNPAAGLRVFWTCPWSKPVWMSYQFRWPPVTRSRNCGRGRQGVILVPTSRGGI